MEREDYTAVAKSLHWLIALFVFIQFPLAWVMDDYPPLTKFELYNLHKSIGITVLAFMLLRLLWRFAARTPTLPARMPRLERQAAQISHFALYLLLFLMPLSGWAMISASDKPSVLYRYMAFPLLPWIGGLPPDQKKLLEPIFQETHIVLSYALLTLIALHVAAALRHAILLRDGVMSRMIPRFGRRSMVTGAMLVLVLGGVLGLSAGALARAAEWQIDPKKSRIGFLSSGSGYTANGAFGQYQAKIAFDPNMPGEAAVEITIDMKSAATGTSDVDEALKSADFFDPAKYATATFVAKGARKVSDGHFVLEGELTMKGVTKPVELPFTFAADGPSATVKGETTINRMDFGVGPASVAGLGVDKNVKLTIELFAMQLGK